MSARRTPRRIPPRRAAVAAGLALTLGLLAAACGGDASLPSEITSGVVATDAPATSAPPQCTDAEQEQDATPSYAPLDEMPEPGAMPEGSTMAEIQASGRLRVGVSADTLLFGARNPFNGEIEGFDIDVLKEVAKAIFGDDGEDRLDYRVITYADRLPSLEADDVDIVAHTMTINCNRWLRIAFSAVYYQAGQKVLVKKGSGFDSILELNDAGAIVCAPEGSTNIEELRTNSKYADVEVLGKDDITDCLVAMQQGLADATTGDDTVLAGFAVQDPNTEVVGDPFTEEPYGLGMNRGDDHVDFVRFVNGVLQQLRDSGRLQEIYDTWLIDTGGFPEGTPFDLPEPNYTRPIPGGS